MIKGFSKLDCWIWAGQVLILGFNYFYFERFGVEDSLPDDIEISLVKVFIVGKLMRYFRLRGVKKELLTNLNQLRL